MTPSQHPDLLAFRGAFGRLCALSAQVLTRDGDREEVRLAFMGEGERYERIRLARLAVDDAISDARFSLGKAGCGKADASKLIVEAARQARDAVQGEWGTTMGTGKAERWIRLSLPIVNPSP